MRPSPALNDYGGNGATFARKGSHTGRCPNCGTERTLPRWAYQRSAKITCPRCGALMEPSKRAQTADPGLATTFTPEVKRRCAGCNCFLRSGNTGQFCSVCERKSWHDASRREREGEKP